MAQIDFKSVEESVRSGVTNLIRNTQDEVLSLKDELLVECVPSCTSGRFGKIKKRIANCTYVPYLPAFHRPGK